MAILICKKIFSCSIHAAHIPTLASVRYKVQVFNISSSFFMTVSSYHRFEKHGNGTPRDSCNYVVAFNY